MNVREQLINVHCIYHFIFFYLLNKISFRDNDFILIDSTNISMTLSSGGLTNQNIQLKMPWICATVIGYNSYLLASVISVIMYLNEAVVNEHTTIDKTIIIAHNNTTMINIRLLYLPVFT